MGEAIGQLATTRATFNRWLKAGRINGFKVGRQWRFKQTDIDHFLAGTAPKMNLKVSPRTLLQELSAYAGLDVPTDMSIDEAARILVVAALKSGASDFHVDIVDDGEGRQGIIRFRMDGIMQPVCNYDARLHGPLIDALKRMGNLDSTESRRPQSGRFQVAVSAVKKIEIAASLIPSVLGECFSGLVRDPSAARMPFDALGLRDENLDRMHHALAQNQGLVVASGPSGSGKLVTAYSMLNHVNTRHLKLITIEDPIELTLANAIQLAVDERADLDYRTLIRSALASNPDVMFVKFIRQPETLLETLDCSLSKLTVTTMQCADAVAGLLTMQEWGARGLLLGEAVKLMSSQRLSRRLCPECMKAETPGKKDWALINRVCQAHGITAIDGDRFAVATGCDQCRGTGYRGRIALFETLPMSAPIESALLEGPTYGEMRSVAMGTGMDALCLDGLRKATQGITSIREVRRVAGDLLQYY